MPFMNVSINRRAVLVGLPAFFCVASATPLAAAEAAIATIEERHGGRLGVFATDTASGRTLEYRADERFLMCSTFKGLLAAQVLARFLSLTSEAPQVTNLARVGQTRTPRRRGASPRPTR